MLFLALLFVLRLTPDTPDTPLKQPQIAANGDTVALTYGAGNTIYFARSNDSGKTFSKAVKVAEPSFLYLGRHRGPRVVMTGDALLITAITGTEHGKGDLVAYRSTDQGETWSKAIRVNDVSDSAREGLHTTAADASGLAWTVWLDLREKGTRLYGAYSTDAGKTWSKNQLVYQSPDGHICECCHPTAYIGPKGELYAMFRNWLNGSRDMYSVVSTDRKTWRAEKLGTGTWPLNACPMDGGGIAIANGTVQSVWRRDDTVYATTGAGPEIAVGKGKDPAMAADPKGPYVAFQQEGIIKLKKPESKDLVTLGKGAFPVLAGTSALYAAWEDDGVVNVERIR